MTQRFVLVLGLAIVILLGLVLGVLPGCDRWRSIMRQSIETKLGAFLAVSYRAR